ncbi:hypothetical protein IF2G_02734 [Cordyceps javanica]|nr:hypothetical protein IF2G_02734 [Cordyceps javanica]
MTNAMPYMIVRRINYYSCPVCRVCGREIFDKSPISPQVVSISVNSSFGQPSPFLQSVLCIPRSDTVQNCLKVGQVTASQGTVSLARVKRRRV